jgi:hypothetical protein
VRPTKLVAGAVLTTALALVALPGLSSSRSPSPDRPIDTAALHNVSTRLRAASAAGTDALDPGYRSAGFVEPDAAFLEPGLHAGPVSERPVVAQPRSRATSIDESPSRTLTGIATFYDNGTTAMRLPRGTLVVICGAGGCIERRITDYGPNSAIHPERIVDLYRPDFFRICGCAWHAGTTRVTVRIY